MCVWFWTATMRTASKRNKIALANAHAIAKRIRTKWKCGQHSFHLFSIRRTFAITTLWPPLHNRKELEMTMKRFYRKPHKHSERIVCIMENNFGWSFCLIKCEIVEIFQENFWNLFLAKFLSFLSAFEAKLANFRNPNSNYRHYILESCCLLIKTYFNMHWIRRHWSLVSHLIPCSLWTHLQLDFLALSLSLSGYFPACPPRSLLNSKLIS